MPDESTRCPRNSNDAIPKTLFAGYEDAVLLWTLQDNLQVLQMFLWGGASNKQVIDIPVAKVEVSYYFINETLKCLSCISQAERHVHKLEKAKGCGDGSHGYVFRSYWDLVVCLHKIDM